VQKYAFTLLFSFFCLYFIQNMVFVPEQNRISNETTAWAVFISALFAFLSLLTVKQRQESQAAKQEIIYKDNLK
jgi:amino acid transporter